SAVLAKCRNGDDLLKISKEYNVPPLGLVRHVLQSRGWPKKLVNSWIITPNRVEDQEIYSLIVRAWENDSENPTTGKILSEKSRQYELQVEKMFRDMGLVFKTQEQLVQEQIERYGRAIRTPDFLLINPVYIVVSHPDGSKTRHLIKWIDV